MGRADNRSSGGGGDGGSGEGAAGAGDLRGEGAGVDTAAATGRSAHSSRNEGGGGEVWATTAPPGIEKIATGPLALSTARKEQMTRGGPAAGKAATEKVIQDRTGPTVREVEAR